PAWPIYPPDGSDRCHPRTLPFHVDPSMLLRSTVEITSASTQRSAPGHEQDQRLAPARLPRAARRNWIIRAVPSNPNNPAPPIAENNIATANGRLPENPRNATRVESKFCRMNTSRNANTTSPINAMIHIRLVRVRLR